MQLRLHIVAPHGCASQWGINAVQFGGVDLPLAVLVLRVRPETSGLITEFSEHEAD
jgi:hypothetical protein